MASILLLEDMGHFRRMLDFVLREDGHTVVEAPDGGAALDPALIARTDLLVTDLDMPSVSGIEAISAAKKAHPEIRVIVMSGGGSVEGKDYLATCMDLGADDIILKPFEPDELVARVRRLLKA